MNIIQTWKTTEIPYYYNNFIQTIIELNPNCKYLFFTDESIVIFVKENFPEYYEIFNNFKYKIQQIDFFRYLVIYHYGGLYLDLDMNITKSFEDLDKSVCSFPIEIKNTNGILIGNYAFYAPKGDLFIKHIIDSIVNPLITEDEIKMIQENHTDDKEHVYVYCSTGPELVTRAYWNYVNRHSVFLLESEPYQNNCFGKYGYHCSYGSWKHPDSNIY
jgi:mannosyltransferase OCH1-like enzyme